MMTGGYLSASGGQKQNDGHGAQVRGTEMHRVFIALLIAAVVSAMGVGSNPAQSVEAQRATDRRASQGAASTASGTSQPSSASALRRLPPLSTGSRLSGEAESILSSVYVTRKQVDAKARFRLGTLSSVSVLPESGTLTVSLNGVNVRVVPVGLRTACGLLNSIFPQGCSVRAGIRSASLRITGAVRTGYGSTDIGHLIGAVRSLTGGEPDLQARAASLDHLSKAALLVAQGPREGDPDSVVTIISSPNAATLRSSVTCLIGPSVWSRLSGRLSVLDASTGAVANSEAETTRYVATQEFSIDNQRLMIAGWLSLNPAIFILIAFLLALPLAATTHFLVRNVGRKNQ
jgi:hypothetical protein